MDDNARTNDSKVPGSWLCPLGFAMRDTWNALQKANGTSQMRHVLPSAVEREAAEKFDQHVTTCKVCSN